MINKKLKALFSLDHNIKLYIPSTNDVNKAVDNSEQVDKVLTLFSKMFGGATSYNAVGAWQSDTKGLIKEKVKIVQSYATAEQVEQYIDKVIEYAETLKKEMSQEAISLEYDNKLYFI